MKIVHINKNDILGGAARAAYRLHKGLQRAGHESTMFVISRQSDDRSVRVYERPRSMGGALRRKISQRRIEADLGRYDRSRPRGLELFSDDRSSYATTLQRQIPDAQIINLHWVPGFVDYQSFFGNGSFSKPAVWTLHDLNPLTGGCHYDLGCGRYVTGCGSCPQLGSREPDDLSSRVWNRKLQLFSRVPASRLHFVTPSQWLSEELKRSPILGKYPVRVIPYGLDLGEFAPRDKAKVRSLLEIPQDARVLLFVAEDVTNRRKGFGALIEALARCAGNVPNLMLLSLGQNKPEVNLRIPWIHAGSLNNDRFLSMVYSAADLFAICSLQDNLPNTVLEAMACGVPVVGTAVGGIPDMVRNGITGQAVPGRTPEALAEAICSLLNDPARCSEMGRNARRIALEEYSMEIQAKRYAELYATLI
jgi:glycosyltransferase involved in cell wall biosynthesis